MILENIGDDNNNNTAILKEWQYCDTIYYDFDDGTTTAVTCYGYVVSRGYDDNLDVHGGDDN